MDTMKVHIEKLGVVDTADITIKPLTVFIGDNNTGKTWTSYVLSVITSQAGLEYYYKAFRTGKLVEKYEIIDNAIYDIKNKGHAQIDLTNLFCKHSLDYINNIARLSPKWLNDYFSTSYASFEDLKVKFTFDNEIDLMINRILPTPIDFKFSPDKEGNAKISIIKEENSPIIHFYTAVSGNTVIPDIAINDFVYPNIFAMFYSSLRQNMYVFPSERTGLSSLKYKNFTSPKTEKGYDISFVKGDNQLEQHVNKPVGYPV